MWCGAIDHPRNHHQSGSGTPPEGTAGIGRPGGGTVWEWGQACNGGRQEGGRVWHCWVVPRWHHLWDRTGAQGNTVRSLKKCKSVQCAVQCVQVCSAEHCWSCYFSAFAARPPTKPIMKRMSPVSWAWYSALMASMLCSVGPCIPTSSSRLIIMYHVVYNLPPLLPPTA